MEKIFRRLAAGMSAAAVLFCGLGVNAAWQEENARLVANAEEGSIDSAEAFLESAYDDSNVTVYNGTSKNPTIYMNGRGYYQGLVFKSDASVSYNVENIDTLSFTMGHVDNTGRQDGTISIYLDDELVDMISLSWNNPIEIYDLDVSGAKVLHISVDSGYDTEYAFGDFSVDAYQPAKTYTTPTYEDEVDFLESGYAVSNLSVYDGSTKNPAFKMNGRGYYQGLVFTGDASVSYNVENVDFLSFTMGHVDDTDREEETVSIYLDEELYDMISLSWSQPLEIYNLDVSSADVLRISVDCAHLYSDAQYAFGDFSVDSYKPSKTYTAPTYKDEVEFMESGYAASNLSVYDGTTKDPAFYMSGRGYYQGLVFSNSASVSYNVENVDSLSFTMGHVDNTYQYDDTVSIYLDNELYDTISLSWNMPLKIYDLDVSDTDVLSISVDCANTYFETKYALADFSVDSYQSAKACTIPTYEDEIEFMKSGFAVSNMSVYDGSTKNPAFYMSGHGYYQGLVFASGADVSYNVENVDSLSFTLGHVDDTDEYDDTVTVYLDNKEYDSFTLAAEDDPISYTIDTSQAKVLRIVMNCYSASYAFADISIVTKEPELTESTPAETTTGTTDSGTTSETTSTTAQMTSTTATESNATAETTTEAWYASNADFISWAMKDYAAKTGVNAAGGLTAENEDGTLSVTLFDENGEVLDTYTIDPATGEGTNASGETVNLPQTGMTSPVAAAVTAGAVFLMLAGMAFLVISKIRRKEETK